LARVGECLHRLPRSGKATGGRGCNRACAGLHGKRAFGFGPGATGSRIHSGCKCERQTLGGLGLLCADWRRVLCCRMFANVQKTQELWMWKMEYLHHEQRPLYFGEWF
jgi:hypothetical protein